MNKDKKLLVMLPTRKRPEGLKKSLESYEKNKTEYSDIVFGFQNDDPFLQDNCSSVIDKYTNEGYWIYGNIGLCRKVNLLSESFPGYGAYMILNDDQIIHTPEFDKKMMNQLDNLETIHGHRLWILHWKDGINDEKLCQSFATKEWIELLGSYYPHGYMKQLYSDNMYHFIGENCGVLNYMPEIYIEHKHICVGKAKEDASYQETQTKERYQQDASQYARWMEEKGIETCEKILTIVIKDEVIVKQKLGEIHNKIQEILRATTKK